MVGQALSGATVVAADGEHGRALPCLALMFPLNVGRDIAHRVCESIEVEWERERETIMIMTMIHQEDILMLSVF